MVMPWVTFVLIAALGVAVFYGWLRAARSAARQTTLVAHSRTARNHPRFKARMSQLRMALTGLVACVVIAAISASVLAGRPRDRVALDSKLATRDIVLCLDVSGSVVEFDGKVLESFKNLVEGFRGERIAMVIWNSSARTVFPLSDDYTMITEQLDNAIEALKVTGGIAPTPENWEDFLAFISGTEIDGMDSSSLVGDGLASCTQAFDLYDTERSRTILLATDNEVAGTQIFTLKEASELAKKKDITVHGLFIDTGYSGPKAAEFEKTLTDNGGYFFEATDPNAAKTLIEDVQAQDAKDLGVVPEVVDADRPGIWIWLAVLGVFGFIVVAWRFRL